MDEMENVKTYTAYFTDGKKLYWCMAWVESKEQMLSMIDEKFKGVKRMDFAYCETHLFAGDTGKKETSPVPSLMISEFKLNEGKIV
ncbi:MAG: hypothetical protein IKQ23_09565 [Treponema sp.]|nr:hypothetical protein [Treponema sp.]